MKLTDIRDFYARSANVLKPWKVVEVEICPETQSVEVRVECEDGTVWTDPKTRERAHVHEWRERRWRHLDTCEYKTVIIAKVPRLKLPSGETMTVVVPWSEEGGGRFTKHQAHGGAPHRKHPTYRHGKGLVGADGWGMVVDANTKATHEAGTRAMARAF